MTTHPTIRALARLLARQAFASQYVPPTTGGVAVDPAMTGNANDNAVNDNRKAEHARRDLREIQQRPAER